MTVEKIARSVLLMCLVFSACGKPHSVPVDTLEVRFDNTNRSEYLANRVRLRNFIWTHWNQRLPARLTRIAISKEGKRADTIFEIKAVGSSTLMQVRHIRYRYGYAGQVIPKEEAEYEVYKVERVLPCDPFMELNSEVKVLRSGENIPASEFCLRLKGWGDQVEGFL
ncbi:MAG: hypothetical protein ACM3JB_27505 [Acidobacteriaceae bacterium]